MPPELEPLAQSVLREALRNVEKHATPDRVEVSVRARGGVLTLEVVNDGAPAPPPRGRDGGGPEAGMGLRLAALEALQAGAVLEFGPAGPGRWRVRLTATPDAR